MGMTKECQIRTWREIGYKVILDPATCPFLKVAMSFLELLPTC